MSWSGAHPTGDIVPDPNSTDGEYEEYPFVLLECRGTASGADAVTPGDLLDPRRELSLPREGVADQPYQLDQYASDPGAAVVGEPSPLPSTSVDPFCQEDETGVNGAPVRYWVPWLAADGTVYDGGQAGFRRAPRSNERSDGGLAQQRDLWRDRARWHGERRVRPVRLDAEATLGCSASVACSLVAVPIMGIGCDVRRVTGAAAADSPRVEARAPSARAHWRADVGRFTLDLTVTGGLWWSPSNWRNRISVPLTFAQTPSSCPIVSYEQRRRYLRLRAHAPGDEPVGALLLPGR